MSKFVSAKIIFDCCCYKNYIPSELVAIIKVYYHSKLTNENIHNAVDEFILDDNMLRFRYMLQFGPISEWDTSEVTNMSNLFSYTPYFNEDITNWDTSNVKIMRSMFEAAIHFNQPLNKWNVSNVECMSEMFLNATRFNQPLDKWDVSNVRIMTSMFENAYAFNQSLDTWNMKNVVGSLYMFDK